MDDASIEYEAETILDQLDILHRAVSDLALFLKTPRDRKIKESLCGSVLPTLEFIEPRGLAQYFNIMSFNEPDAESCGKLNQMIDEIAAGEFADNDNILSEYKLIINLKSKKS